MSGSVGTKRVEGRGPRWRIVVSVAELGGWEEIKLRGRRRGASAGRCRGRGEGRSWTGLSGKVTRRSEREDVRLETLDERDGPAAVLVGTREDRLAVRARLSAVRLGLASARVAPTLVGSTGEKLCEGARCWTKRAAGLRYDEEAADTTEVRETFDSVRLRARLRVAELATRRSESAAREPEARTTSISASVVLIAADEADLGRVRAGVAKEEAVECTLPVRLCGGLVVVVVVVVVAMRRAEVPAAGWGSAIRRRCSPCGYITGRRRRRRRMKRAPCSRPGRDKSENGTASLPLYSSAGMELSTRAHP